MTFDPKYGYARIGNKSFTPGGRAAPAPRDSNGGDEAGSGTGARKYSTRRRYTGYTRSSPASRSPTSAAAR